MNLTLGDSESNVVSMLQGIYGDAAYSGPGCRDYETTCYYYQENGTKTSFMVEVHDGSNSLHGQTKEISFDLSKYNTGGTTAISKNKVVNACKKMDAFALEKGRQNVYLSNMYRAYHGMELSNYSEIASEYAYISAYVRSQLSYKGHLEYFTGDFELAAIRKTVRTTGLNEWWSGWQETFSENAGYQSGADAVSVLAGQSLLLHILRIYCGEILQWALLL